MPKKYPKKINRSIASFALWQKIIYFIGHFLNGNMYIRVSKYKIKMNKAELIETIAADAGITKTQAGASLDSFMDTIVNTLKKGDTVTLVGFGTFSVSARAARNGRNPQTGETIKIKAKKVPKFKAGKDFVESVAKAKTAAAKK